MIALKTMKHIATSRTIPSFRSGNSPGGLSQKAYDKARMAAGIAQLLARKSHRRWLNLMYHNRALR